MNTRTLSACCGLALLIAAGTAQAQVAAPPQAQAQAQAKEKGQTPGQPAPSVTCDLKDETCRKRTLGGLSQSVAAVGDACGPVAGCGNPPQVGKPWDRLKLSDAQRADLARAIVLLYEGTTLTPKDVDNMLKKVGPLKP